MHYFFPLKKIILLWSDLIHNDFMLVLFISWPMNSATVILITTVIINNHSISKAPERHSLLISFKFNNRWPCSKFDHGQCCVTFQYKDLYNTGKKITSWDCECERIYIVFYFYFFDNFFFGRVFLLLSSYQLIL